MKVFAIGRGQYENVGDIILRRQLLDWVRPLGELHVYVGHSPTGYSEGLHLSPDDREYRSLRDWYREALAAARRGEAVYVFKPGEIQLTLIGMKEHLSMLPLLVTLRRHGGAAVRVGVGTRNTAALPRALMRPSLALSDLTLWRDDMTAEYMRHGRAMPDLAFGEGADDAAVAGFAGPSPERDVLVVSMRADHLAPPYPDRAWLDGVRRHADEAGLENWAVTQVHVDNDRTLRLAHDLGGQALTWEDLAGHDEQEKRLRELYARTAMALSDRLHVLVAAFTEGAVPAAPLIRPSDKVDRHFTTIGIPDVSFVTAGMPAAELAARLEQTAERRPEMFRQLADARRRLRADRDEVERVLTRRGTTRGQVSSATARPTVWHLGRAGDVAGGMTQVLNGYLDWSFPRVDVGLITSRGNPHDLRAAAVRTSSAAARLLRLPRRTSVVSAHLSERGSFVREGALMRLASARGIATVAHLHGSSFADFAAAHPRLTGWALSAADRVITLSDESSEVAARFVPAERVRLVPNAIPAGQDRPKRDLVVFGGVVSHRKGIDVLQDAWQAVRAPGWELVVAGPVQDADLVREGVPGMRLVGSLAHDELMELLAESRIAVLPSRHEAMPMFILEAMARGNCVVSTDVGGIAAVLTHGRGLVLPPGDTDALRDALQSVIDDADLRDRLAAAAREAFTETYSAEAVFPRVEELWLSALEARRTRSVR